jgi:hypothetical protein
MYGPEGQHVWTQDACIPRSVWANKEVSDIRFITFVYLALVTDGGKRAHVTLDGLMELCGYSLRRSRPKTVQAFQEALNYWANKSDWFKIPEQWRSLRNSYLIEPLCLEKHVELIRKCGGYISLAWDDFHTIIHSRFRAHYKVGILRTYLNLKQRIEYDCARRSQWECQCSCVSEKDLLGNSPYVHQTLRSHLEALCDLGLLYVLNSGLAAVDLSPDKSSDVQSIISAPKCYCFNDGTFSISAMYNCCANKAHRIAGSSRVVIQSTPPTLKAPPGANVAQLVASIYNFNEVAIKGQTKEEIMDMLIDEIDQIAQKGLLPETTSSPAVDVLALPAPQVVASAATEDSAKPRKIVM